MKCLKPFRVGIALMGLMLLFFVAVGSASAADERILDFSSLIRINTDSSMIVTETVRVRAEGDQIRHGIYRDFPTRYRDEYGNSVVVDFELASVRRDGRTEPYREEDLSNGKRIYIGDPGVLLEPGEYTYEITYRTDRQLGYFSDHDELYWNVTGNGWMFPIDHASAVVILPPGAMNDAVKVNGYTGPKGSTSQNYRCSFDGSGRLFFETTSPLNSYEGLTIVAAWPKGLVTQADARQKAVWFVRDNLGVIVGLIGFLLILGYYGLVWSIVGKDPPKQTIIPQYTPPDGFSPAAIRYITRMGYDQKIFAVALIDMAVKGYLRIVEAHGIYKLVKGGKGEAPLSPEEQKIAAELDLDRRDELQLDNGYCSIYQSAIAKLRQTLKSSYEKTYFVRNMGYFLVGAAATVLATVISALSNSGGMAFLTIFLSVWLLFWSIGVYALVRSVIACWQKVFAGGPSVGVSIVAAVFLSCFSIPFVGGEIVGFYFLLTNAPWFGLILILYAGTNILFYHLVKAPTVSGRRLMDQFDGFRLYLETAERDRLNMLNPPDRTPELFERYLPYAMALGVEQAWAEQFADVLAEAGRSGQAYSPAWYSGSQWGSLGAGGFASTFASSFAGAVSSASTAPGSSSGGGGGSSGGGGGGGGGGGW